MKVIYIADYHSWNEGKKKYLHLFDKKISRQKIFDWKKLKIKQNKLEDGYLVDICNIYLQLRVEIEGIKTFVTLLIKKTFWQMNFKQNQLNVLWTFVHKELREQNELEDVYLLDYLKPINFFVDLVSWTTNFWFFTQT